MVDGVDTTQISLIDAALRDWRQGDAVLDATAFMVYLADRRFPLTASAREAAVAVDDDDIFDVLMPVCGIVVISQTCDIVKTCAQSEFVEVCRLVQIEDDQKFQDVRKSRRPRYAYLPGLSAQKLAADLEHTMTIEKAVLAQWKRVEGCTTDEERVIFAKALARKRQRFAFPDGFNTALKKFRNNIKEKHGKSSSEGILVDAIHEIRVRSAPSWSASKTEIFFWFLLHPGLLRDFNTARSNIEKWIGRIEFTDPFYLGDPAFALVEPEDMTVADYFNSQLLDYDDVSP